MVWHQTIGPHADTGLARGLANEVAVQRIVVGLEKGRLAAVATLRDVIGQTGDDEAGETSQVGEDGLIRVFSKLSP